MRHLFLLILASVFSLDATAASADSNVVYLDQFGVAGSAEIVQEGTGSRVDLRQAGSLNSVHGSGWTDGSIFDGIRQDRSAKDSVVDMVQTGSHNVFDITQGGAHNRAAVIQNGANGAVSIRQGASEAGAPPAPARGARASAGDNSAINVNQTTITGWNYADVVQGSGSGNHVSATQTGGYLISDIRQSGSGNSIDSTQWGGGEKATLTQSGRGNNITGQQFGFGNQAAVTQDGDGNVGLYSQIGNANALQLNQRGNGNTAIASQVGANNSVTITHR